jgi:hypothetical protein
MNVSVDYQLKNRQLKFFGETALSANKAIATLNALQWTPTSYASGLLLYRSYARDYQSFYGNAFSQGSMVQNEQGLYLGIQLAPAAHWKLSGYADFFRFPWLKFGIDAPSSGVEYMAQAEYAQLDKFSMYVRYRYRQKESNRTVENRQETDILPDMQHRFRVQMSCKPTAGFASRTSFDWTFYDAEQGSKSRGWMVAQMISWKPSPIPLQTDLYLAWFNTDDYASRIYAYEKKLLYVYNSPSFYDKGTRLSGVFRINLTRKLSFSTKIGWTHYFDRETIGSGLETIEGNNRVDVDIMLLWKF